MLRFILSFFGGIFTTITLGLVMCGLGLGAILHVYAQDLPSYESLANYTPKTVSRIYSAEGQIIDEFAEERRLFTPAEEIPDLVKQAFISAEDKNFYEHPGYDPRGIAAAAYDAVVSRGENLRGASTITQQVTKNLLLDGARRGLRGFERKIKEIILAPRIELAMDKERILEIYLTEIDLGVRSFGVTAAALSYFNKPLKDLNPAEAAFLAVHPKAPYSYHPVNDREAALDRRNFILREMNENGYLTDDEYATALADPLRTVQNGDFSSYQSERQDRDYFTAEIRRQVTQQFGLSPTEFSSAGYAIRATVEPTMQLAAADALQRALEQYDRGIGAWRGTGKTIPVETLGDETLWRAALADTVVPRDIQLENEWYPAAVLAVEDNQLRVGIEGMAETDAEPFVVPRRDIEWMRGNFADNFTAGDVVHVRRMTQDSDGAFIRWTLRQVPEVSGGFMAMDVNTGRVVAMQGGFSFQSTQLNRATQAFRQPGSAFKPFVYAAALDSGYSPATIVVDAPIEINTPQGVWRPQNASNQFYGPTPLRTGIEQSRNLMTIRLAQEVGIDTVGRYAEKFGVYDSMNRVLSTALGSDETTLYRIVAAYAMFANGGERVEPTLVDRVQDRTGETVFRHDQRVCEDCDGPIQAGVGPRITSNRERVMNEITAYQLTSMMRGVVERGTARSAVKLPVPIAGKTGTTNDAKDVWFVGFSSNIVAGCYIGFDTPRSLGKRASGGGICGPVFNSFMTQAIKKYGGGDFYTPPECNFIKIDRFSGARLPDSAGGDNVIAECFRPGEIPLFGITFDGGFAMSADLPLFDNAGGTQAARTVTTSTGSTATVGPKATFGTLSSGGLY